MRVEEVAAKVVYLADGDEGGAKHLRNLMEAGVAKDRIFQLPEGKSTEDMINRDDYVRVINGLLDEMNTRQTVSSNKLSRDKTIARALTDWAELNRVRLPSKVEIAYALLGDGAVRLNVDGRKTLRRLHKQFITALSSR